jgi:hypothetical protein
MGFPSPLFLKRSNLLVNQWEGKYPALSTAHHYQRAPFLSNTSYDYGYRLPKIA